MFGISNHTGFLPPHSLLFQRYQIVALAGQGGMGAVYQALDTHEHNRMVAIKEMSQANLRPEQLVDAQQRFHGEANLLGSLQHPNLPQVYTSFTENGRSYLVMEFIAGKTLQELMQESPTGSLPVGQVISYALQLCAVLSYLHEHAPPIVFRDLKPSNVMVTDQGRVYLIDFGIARLFKQGQRFDTESFGSLGYAPPEQFGHGQTSPRSDLYSLGATLFTCLTGRHPNDNQPTPFHFQPVRHYNPAVPIELSNLIQQLVATDAARRPSSAYEVYGKLLVMQQQGASTTVSLHGSDPFYDAKTAYAAQFGGRMRRYNNLPGKPGLWLSLVIIPFVAHMYGHIRSSLAYLSIPYLRSQLTALPTRLLHVVKHIPAYLPLSFTPPVWTWRFGLLFLALFAVTVGGSLYALIGLQAPVHVVILGLCLLLLGLVVLARRSKSIHNGLTRNILTGLIVGLLGVCLALPAFADVQAALNAIRFGQVIGMLILLLAGISLWRADRYGTWASHLALGMIALLYACTSYSLGSESLSALFSGAAPLVLQLINGLLCLCLLVCAVCSFARIRRAYAWFDRVMVFIVSIIAIALQLHLGSLNELVQTPLSAALFWMGKPGENQDMVFNVLLGWGPLLIALLWIFLVSGSTRLARISLTVLAVACVLLQNMLENAPATHPVPVLTGLFATSFMALLNVNLLAAYGLLILVALQLLRARHFFTALERGIIHLVALLTALLQAAIWSHASSSLPADPRVLPGWRAAPQVGMEIVVGNQVGAVIFLWCIVGMVGAVAGRVIWRHVKSANQQNSSLNNSSFQWQPQLQPQQSWKWPLITMRLEHLILWLTTLALVLTLPFFGTASGPLSSGLGGGAIGIDLNQLLWWMLLLFLVVGLFRLVRPFSGWDRWQMLCNTLVLGLLFFDHGKKGGNTHTNIIAWFANPHIVLPFYIATMGLIVIALLSLLWLKRAFQPTERTILWICFGLALCCAFLQIISPIFLLAACVLLFQGILFVTRVELVR
ncbi:serine/threonine-protein kinase [Dictyobacter aurantiacus]|uniref:non-specific serine/threonine protein kinase n=1 Tax=Dictyobacter aurantiacus TaxID=1936993 RepID=A0A401ZG14_9CHLR|nr:serine/threonine-protein kinase [Dictyobacter aurantiacus]GCE05802.1 hypothetical protein KDAU_31310 [Dictyobacter aurantiacus]